MWLKELFGKEKVIIGVVHLLPLPGSPRYRGNFEEVLERALEDAKALERGGVDGMIVENYGDKPFYPDNVPKETIAAMSIVVSRVVEEVSVPVGVNVLRNDVEAALAICAVSGASFVRANVLMGVVLAGEGILVGKGHEVLRYRARTCPSAKILADVRVKHGVSLWARDVRSEALELAERGLCDGLIVTGPRTGEPPEEGDIRAVKEAGLPVFVGSGVSFGNAKKFWEICDGLIVGTYFKHNGRVENPVDVRRVEKITRLLRASP